MSTETATSIIEVASAIAIVVGVALLATAGAALIVGGILGIVFSVRVSS